MKNDKDCITIPIMFCFDRNYAIPASVAFYSLLENARKNINRYTTLESSTKSSNRGGAAARFRTI